MICLQHDYGTAQVLVLDQGNRQLDLSLFQDRELVFVQHNFKDDERRQEWMWGRYAAKLLLQNPMVLQASAEIIPSQNTRPLLQSVDGDLSLSHDAPYFAAGFCLEGKIGIDLVKKGVPRNYQAFDMFCTEREIEIATLQGFLPQEDYYYLLWCFKEAYLKASGGTNSAQMLENPFRIIKEDDGFSIEPLGEPSKNILMAKAYLTPDFYFSVVVCGEE